MEESDCIPMNVVDWTNTCLGHGECDKEILKAVLNDNEPTMTDYLVEKIPDNCLVISISELYKTTTIFEKLLKIPPDIKKSVINIFRKTQKSCYRTIQDMITTDGGRKVQCNTYEAMYSVMTMSGIIAFLWMLSTRIGMNDIIFSITPEDFNVTSRARAQDLIFKWDNACGANDIIFTYEDYEQMRQAFKSSLNSAANKVIESLAKAKGIGRNDKCPCGSGKKFKQCHARAGLDFLI